MSPIWLFTKLDEVVSSESKNSVLNFFVVLWNDKRSLIPWGAKVPILKINFCSEFLWLSMLPR